jgi:DNA-directed RNA polymerase sigma subunit (sigma70/sigma32)
VKKREAAELLGAKSIKDLASMLDINYDSLRTMKRLSSIHIKLVRWEVDKQFIAAIKNIDNFSIEATTNHSSKQREIDKLVAQGLADEEARANDSGLDN